ncbi:sulfatase-like hydrolase/transferase [candidate division KSB1 bacterium]
MEPTTRRDFLKTAGLLTATAAFTGGCGRPPGLQKRPNVVLIMTDDQGYGDVGMRGNDIIQTPNIDRFTREGVDFARFYSCPVCAPTRAGLLTGRYHYRTGVIHTSRGGAKMDGDEVTIAERLRDSGYATGIFGKWHLGDNHPMRPQDQGFGDSLVHLSGAIGQAGDIPNSYFDPVLWRNGRQVQTEGYCTDIFTEAAISFIETNRNRPFFLYLPTNAPHTPLEVAPEYSDPYKAMGLSDTTAKIYGMVANIDDNVGRLLARLDTLKLRENTIVIFMSDNGPQQPRYNAGLRGLKASAYEGGIRVPFFIRWPDRFSGGGRIDRIAANIDIHPTLLDACAIGPVDSPTLDGVSLLPMLDGDNSSGLDRKIFIQCHRSLEPKRYQNCAVLTDRYKLLGYPDKFNDEQFAPPREPTFELYDIPADPGEAEDLAGNYPEIVTRLRSAYENWFEYVKNTRHFTPGRISIGSEAVGPVRLSRYQDSTYVDGLPTGWEVDIKRSGHYEIRINRGEEGGGKCRLHVKINSTETNRTLEEGQDTALFHLPAGPAKLEIWTQEEGRPRVVNWSRDRLGDVVIRLKGPSQEL